MARGKLRRFASAFAPAPREAIVFDWRVITLLLEEEDGSDLVEYCLLLGFVVLAGAAISTDLSNNISGLWSTIASKLASTN